MIGLMFRRLYADRLFTLSVPRDKNCRGAVAEEEFCLEAAFPIRIFLSLFSDASYVIWWLFFSTWLFLLNKGVRYFYFMEFFILCSE